MVSGEHCAFPDLSLFALTVTEHCEYGVVVVVEFLGEGDADGCGKTLAEGT